MTLAKSKVSAKSKAKQYISNFALIGQQVLFTVTWVSTVRADNIDSP